MTATSMPTLVTALRDAAHPLTGAADDFAPLLDRIGNAPLVLIGEASHGTHEFYRIRAQLTKQLIETRGFRAVAVEGDWPDAYRVNRYVRGRSLDRDAAEALEGFQRFPQWMWRNADVLDFVGWLRARNAGRPDDDQVGFYGLDLYSLHASMDAVLRYLRTVDPAAAKRAAERYACFDQFGSDPQWYGQSTALGLTPTCQREVVAQLLELQRLAATTLKRARGLAADELFFAEQNARVVANAERYYRTMIDDHTGSWNLRDLHMAETLQALVASQQRATDGARIVVWAHNSHLGDARATEMSPRGELNLGQLARLRYGDDAFLIGFSTYQGTVTAASNWDEPAQCMRVRLALPESVEALCHRTGLGNLLLDLVAGGAAATLLAPSRLERAIGVIYRPHTERQSHYFHASVARQFDALLHYDTTRAVEPLERMGLWEPETVPETYPTAL